MDKETLKKKIFEALEDDKYKWRTTKGIAKQTDIPEEEVKSVIGLNRDSIVQSSGTTIKGDSLFTTRDHIKEKNTAFDKLVGAFKGRIR